MPSRRSARGPSSRCDRHGLRPGRRPRHAGRHRAAVPRETSTARKGDRAPPGGTWPRPATSRCHAPGGGAGRDLLAGRPDARARTAPGRRAADALTGGSTTVGLRVPDHEAPRTLARALGPMPVTSANVSGQPEASTAPEIRALLGGGIELILDGGPARGGTPSTVIDATDRSPGSCGPARSPQIASRPPSPPGAFGSSRRGTRDRPPERCRPGRRPCTLTIRRTLRPRGWPFVGRYPSMRRRAPAAPAAPRPATPIRPSRPGRRRSPRRPSRS